MTDMYVRMSMTVPEAGTVTHVAEIREIDHTKAEMLRIIELDDADVVRGAGTPDGMHGTPNVPQRYVPHPDSYDTFPDIMARRIDASEFEALWAEALAKFPELG